jgi:hypothetical protein
MKPQYILPWLGLLLCVPALLNAQDYLRIDFGVKVNLGASQLVLHEINGAFFDSVAATNAKIVFTGDKDLVFFPKIRPSPRWNFGLIHLTKSPWSVECSSRRP